MLISLSGNGLILYLDSFMFLAQSCRLDFSYHPNCENLPSLENPKELVSSHKDNKGHSVWRTLALFSRVAIDREYRVFVPTG